MQKVVHGVVMCLNHYVAEWAWLIFIVYPSGMTADTFFHLYQPLHLEVTHSLYMLQPNFKPLTSLQILQPNYELVAPLQNRPGVTHSQKAGQ